MGKYSTYRYLELQDDTAAPHINVRSRPLPQPRRLKKVFVFLIVLALCVTYLLGMLAGQTQWFDGLAKSLGYESTYHYAVVVDAGSSGSRVLAYKFRVPFTVFGQADLDLVDEYFEQSKPGLSSFADEPERGAATIAALVRRAGSLVPGTRRADTPLLVRATAGLRLLSAPRAAALLAAVERAVRPLGYQLPDGVRVMSGADEGIFIWYTVNLLHYLIGSGRTMAALDLGGGSTQITMELSAEEAARAPPADLHVVPAGDNVTLYTHSYLKMGLLAARLGVFQLEAAERGAPVASEGGELRSACVDPIVQREPWTYGNRQYYVSGLARPEGMKRAAAYAACHGAARRYVERTLRPPPPAAPATPADPPPPAPPALRAPVAAMSYFYDVAADAGLIDVMRGGVVTVSSFRAAGLRACSAANVEQPWACVDLALLVALLADGYRLRDNEPVSLFRKVNGHEVSWALGLAYTTVMNRLAATPAASAGPAAPAAPAA